MLEALFAAAWMLAAPLCPGTTVQGAPAGLLASLNAMRAAAGRAPLQAHRAVCALAGDLAAQASRSGGPPGEVDTLSDGTRVLYRRGYAPHTWSAGTVIGSWGRSLLDQWHEVDEDGWRRARDGDSEHIGLGLASRAGRPVLAVVVAETKRRAEWRRAAPLADREAVRRAVKDAVDRARRQAGVAPVLADPRLDRAAQGHADDLLARGDYAHRGADGRTVGRRVRDAGHPRCRRVAENIAKGLFAADEVVSRWMNSPGHRRNILDRTLTHMGMGVAVGDGPDGVEALWVQVFASCGG